ncbi:MAG TPA: hypothetical protein DCW59_16615, partial [Alteromonas sp.]|nr:hypothetical protein [Alteromonas sp.]
IALGVIWLVIMAALCMQGLTLAKIQVLQEHEFREQSDVVLGSVAIWHLKTVQEQLAQLPSAQTLWETETSQQRLTLQSLWVFQGLAWALMLVIIYLAIHTQLEGEGGNPLLLVVPMLLLSAGDWLGRSFNGQPALNRYVQGKQALKTLPVDPLQLTDAVPLSSTLTLTGFGSVNLPEQKVTAEFDASGLYLVGGPSGAGKSQLLQAVSGLVACHGQRLCDGDAPGEGLIEGWLYLEQQPVILAATLRHNLTLGRDFSATQLNDVLSKVGLAQLNDLGEWLGPGGRVLSGGERKRLGIARAMLIQSPVWLLDEPFEGLDGAAVGQLVALLQREAATRLIIIASHVYPAELQCKDTLILNPPS